VSRFYAALASVISSGPCSFKTVLFTIMSRTDQLREELGTPSRTARSKIENYLVPFVKNFIARSPFAVLATSDADGNCDASPKGGRPGFIKVVDDHTLLIPDLGGNRLFQSYANVEGNAKAGLVFMIPGQDITVRVNGSVDTVDRDEVGAMGVEPEVYRADKNTNMVQGLLLRVDESYFHCARSMMFSDLWNTHNIEANRRIKLSDELPNATPAAAEKEELTD